MASSLDMGFPVLYCIGRPPLHQGTTIGRLVNTSRGAAKNHSLIIKVLETLLKLRS